MKVLDLHTGEEVTMPLRMAPGRYRLLASATLNATVALGVGDVLWSDGGTRCDLRDAQGIHWSSTFEPISADQSGDWEVVDQGVLTVASLVDESSEDLPAPLMPNSLTNFADPSEFERTLERVLDDGHLHEISAHPRMSVRYDATVLPVSRARRLASGSVERLASRSEDWHRRTLGGVEPARVLAEVSEDEWAIYENIVFARLIDQAVRLISRHERQLARCIDRQKKAIELNQAEDLHRLLRDKLCKLWGQAWDAKPQEVDDPLQTRLNELRTLSHRLRQLRFGHLYKAIARSARVPVALRNTNVLMHDPNYREMRNLWQLAYQGEFGSKIRPEEKIRQRMAQHTHYDTFVGLLARHALKDCRTLKPSGSPDEWRFAGAKLILQQPHPFEWQLSLDWSGRSKNATKTLTFLAAWAGNSQWPESIERSHNLHEHQTVYCHPIHTEVGVTETGEDGVLNPLQFYAVERIKHRIESWLYQQAFSLYPLEISSMPTHLREELRNKAPQAFVSHNKGLRIMNSAKNLDAIGLARGQGANIATLEKLSWGIELVDTLATCRVCGETSALKTDPLQSTLWASCVCGYEWGVGYRGECREMVFRFRTQTNEEGAADFKCNGAWSLRQQVA